MGDKLWRSAYASYFFKQDNALDFRRIMWTTVHFTKTPSTKVNEISGIAE